MAADITRDEFEQLKGRVRVLEGEVDGEKLVSRHVLQQTRHNGDDLAAVKTRLDRLEGRMDALEARMDALEGRMARLETRFESLETNLPKIIGDVMRAVLSEKR